MAKRKKARKPSKCGKPRHRRGDPKGTKRYGKGCGKKSGRFAKKGS